MMIRNLFYVAPSLKEARNMPSTGLALSSASLHGARSPVFDADVSEESPDPVVRGLEALCDAAWRMRAVVLNPLPAPGGRP